MGANESGGNGKGNGAISVTVWNEYLHEVKYPEIAAVYPKGIHGCIADFLAAAGMDVRTATLREESHGLTDAVLEATDVLIWWGHMAHGEVSDAIVQKVFDRVQDGMGLIVLHSGHASKIFQKLCGSNSGGLKWREDGEKEIVWIIDRSHPIAEGIDDKILIPHEEMYGEPFGIPAPDELVFASWFEGGEIFRSGCCFKRGKGRIFYFRPGHEAFPVYHMPEIQRVIINAVRWAKAPYVARFIDGHTVTPVVEFSHTAEFHSIGELHRSSKT
ncbi:MAG: ThuA domain-containing protein [Clostridiales bacterium]|jgi:trehalose utilization protein|nr:ThuA domain-containing protein [Clostridiales bacterium]